MKLVFAIVNKEDSNAVSTALTHSGFSVTKLATTGGFLRAGNTTFLIGTEDVRVDELIELIAKTSRKRTHTVSNVHYGDTHYTSFPTEVTVGGATIFVTDIERYEKL